MYMINQAVYLALCSALGLRSDHWETPFRIRQAYVSPASPPPPEDQDVLYFHVVPGNRPPLTESSVISDGRPSFFRYAPYVLNLVFYGPHAEETAWTVYHHLFLDGCENPRRILRLNDIYPVPNPPGPVQTWENWKERHRLRMDLVIPLRVARTRILPAASAGSVESPPEMNLHPGGSQPASSPG